MCTKSTSANPALTLTLWSTVSILNVPMQVFGDKSEVVLKMREWKMQE